MISNAATLTDISPSQWYNSMVPSYHTFSKRNTWVTKCFINCSICFSSYSGLFCTVHTHNIIPIYTLIDITPNSGLQLNIHLLHSARCKIHIIPLRQSVISVFETGASVTFIYIHVGRIRSKALYRSNAETK